MKRFIAILTLFLGISAAAYADERPIDISQLPKNAQEFVLKHFKGIPVLYANMDRDMLDTDYELRLEDGTAVDFNGRGEWTEISNKRTGVPAAVVPAKIVEHLRKQYPDAKLLTIDRDSRDYEVKLSNGLELTFTLDGRLIGIDD